MAAFDACMALPAFAQAQPSACRTTRRERRRGRCAARRLAGARLARPGGRAGPSTTRAGGVVSQGPYASMNLGTHVGDDPRRCQPTAPACRRPWSIHTGRPPCVFKPGAWHGRGCVDRLYPDNTEADACVATDAGVVCTIMVADCLPVLLHPHQWRRGGCCSRGLAGPGRARAGWVCWNQPCVRCLNDFKALALTNKAQAAIENVANNTESFETVARGTLAWLGPCIGPQAFEVGPEVRGRFALLAPIQRLLCSIAHQQGKWLADLAGWPVCACRPWASRAFMAMTAAQRGARSPSQPGSFPIGATRHCSAAAGVWPPASGAVEAGAAAA